MPIIYDRSKMGGKKPKRAGGKTSSQFSAATKAAAKAGMRKPGNSGVGMMSGKKAGAGTGTGAQVRAKATRAKPTANPRPKPRRPRMR